MPRRTDLSVQADRLRDQAELILRGSKLLELLKNYGDPHLTGSYVLNLMTTGDIDIHVINSKITETRVKEGIGGVPREGAELKSLTPAVTLADTLRPYG